MDAQVKTRVTFEEYSALPETNQIVELIDGEIIVNPPLDAHQQILGEIYLSSCPLPVGGTWRFAPTGVHFDDGNSPEPDLFWVSANNDHCVLDEHGRYWNCAPDLVIEILSPSTQANDRGIKFETYQKYGVREYWLVDPESRFVEAHHHEDGKFARQDLFKAGESFVSQVLNDATIETQSWFSGEA